MDVKLAIAGVSIAMTLAGYYYYLRDIFRGKTKPHAYSWLVWGLLTAIAFFGQISDGGGAGAYVTAVTAGVSFFIFFLAISRGEKNATRSNKLNLVAALLAIIPWLLTKDPLLSVILITIIDFLGFLPTIRKSWHKPFEETVIMYVFGGLKFIPAIIALDHYSVTTWLYPASLVAANLLFALMLVVRRRQLVEKGHPTALSA